MGSVATNALLIGLAPSLSTGQANEAMAMSVALALENAVVTERDTQRLEEASLTVTLALLIRAGTAAVAKG